MRFLLAAADLGTGGTLNPGPGPGGSSSIWLSNAMVVIWIGLGFFVLLSLAAWFKYGRKQRKRKRKLVRSESNRETVKPVGEAAESTRRNPSIASAGGLPPPKTDRAGSAST